MPGLKTRAQTRPQLRDDVAAALGEDTPRPDGSLIRIDGFTQLPLEESGRMPADYVCPFLQQPAKLWVASDGTVSPCCAPVELRTTLGDFGNVADGGLLNILLSEPYQARGPIS